METKSFSTPTQLPSAATGLHGLWLFFARMVWLIVVSIALLLFFYGISVRTEKLGEQYQPKIGTFLYSKQPGEVLLFPWFGYPSIRAGILNGDVLLALNGNAPHVERSHFLEALNLTGPAGSPVSLTVRTGNHPPREYTVLLGGEDPVALARMGLSVNFMTTYTIIVQVLFALICLGIAGLIFLRRSNDWVGLLASLTLILFLLNLSEHVFAVYIEKPAWRPVLDAWFAFILLSMFLFFCIFPDGQFVPRWTGVLVAFGLVWIVAQWLDPRLYPWKMPFQKGFGILMAWLSVGILAQIYRYRYHASSTQRQQTKWILFGMISSTIGLLGLVYDTGIGGIQIPPGAPTVLFDLAGYPVLQLFKLFLPLGIAIAILRHRLWDIDIIINRTLVYGTLTASVIGIYVVVVGALGTTIQGSGNLLLSILATGLVAVLVQPLRDRLQRGVNRMMYGERDDPVTVLSRLGERLEGTLAPDAVLPSLVETIAQTLKLPYVAIETAADHAGQPAPAVSYGDPQAELIQLPLVYQSEIMGELIVSPRAPGEALSPMDRHLLENIAHQAGMAVHAVGLTADLQRSRQRLVNAREEERRRLRRDLHDGLGPNLASQGLKMAAIKQHLKNDPASALGLLDDVIIQNQSTVEEVRRLVYGLRPPALDELGLVAAIRDYLAGMDGKAALQIEVTEPPEGLPPLSAAVEVAAYRIVLEALTNVIRHAHARYCAIRFSYRKNGSVPWLEIEIADDGVGLPHDLRAGVGLRSMRERAEELDGTLVVESQPRLTRVQAILPIREMDRSIHSSLDAPE